MAKVVYSRAATKTLRRMPRDQAGLILKKIEQLAGDPAALARNIAKLVNEPGYRLRVGDWRITFERRNDTLEIWYIGPRGAAYR